MVFDFERTHGKDDAVTSVLGIAGLHSVAEQDAASALSLIQQSWSWLEARRCFEPAHNPLVPWTGDVRWRKWDDEHHVAKHWLSKLPTFSFVVMYQVTELEETTREHVAGFT